MIVLIVTLFSLVNCIPSVVLNLNSSSSATEISKLVSLGYSVGFDSVFAPLQITKDNYPRYMVSGDTRISETKILDYYQETSNNGNPVSVMSLSEFLGTSQEGVKKILLPVTKPEDVTAIVHDFSLSPRETSNFVMVLPYQLAEFNYDRSDSISRYKTMVPDGEIIILADRIENMLYIDILMAKSVLVPFDSINAQNVILAKEKGLTIGAFNVGTKQEFLQSQELGLDFVMVNDPLKYLTFTLKRPIKSAQRTHAATLFV